MKEEFIQLIKDTIRDAKEIERLTTCTDEVLKECDEISERIKWVK